MATQAATLSNTITAIQNLSYQSGYAQKEIQVLLNAGKADLSDPAVLAQIEQAYQFFEAMHNCGQFTDPATGKVMNFSVYGAGGIFGSQSSKFQDLVDKALNSFNSIKIPDPLGGNDTVYDKKTGKPATLLDLIAHPSDGFTFSFKQGNWSSCDYTNVSWCKDPAQFFGGVGSFFGGSADHTFDTKNGQIQVHDSESSVYNHGGSDTYTCTANVGAIEDCATVGASDMKVATDNINALDNFLSSEM